MGKCLRAAACCAVVVLVAVPAFAQKWERFSSETYNITFSVPGKWKTETTISKAGVPSLESESPDGSLYLIVYAYKDSTVSTEDLLDQAVDDLDVKLKGNAEEEDINGLHAWVAEATGRIDGHPVGMFIMAATYEDDNYVAYIFTDQAAFQKNASVMNRILDSFAPLKK